MFLKRARLSIDTERMTLRLPEMEDHADWVNLRRDSETFLQPWEPVRQGDQTSRRAFRDRVNWACLLYTSPSPRDLNPNLV